MSPKPFAAIEKVECEFLSAAGVELNVLRLDNFAPALSGNKAFKLKYNIKFALSKGYKKIISFGGAYSNHIHALALAGCQQQFETVGMIRGDEFETLNPTLQDAVDAGMKLQFLTRSEYRNKNDGVFLQSLQAKYPDAFIVPEGGSNLLGVQGCAEIVDHVVHHFGDDYDVIALPCGTAATLAGVSLSPALRNNKRVLGFSVLKNSSYLDEEVRNYHQQLGVSSPANWQIEYGFHCGGYAKVNQALAEFVDRFQAYSGIEIEPVYTGKMFYGLYQLLKQLSNNKTNHSSPIKSGCRIVAIHTGGLQGMRGMTTRMDRLNSHLLAG